MIGFVLRRLAVSRVVTSRNQLPSHGKAGLGDNTEAAGGKRLQHNLKVRISS